MPRTNTVARTSFTRSGQVTYSFHKAPRTTITLPAGSTWSSNLHWHESHTEYLLIIQGRACVTLDSSTDVFTSSSGIITIPRHAVHEWKRAEEHGEDLVVEEWTEPADGGKEVFFRNLSSVIEDEMRGRQHPRVWLLEWKLWVVFWQCDNWPVLWGTHKLVRWTVTHLVLTAAALLGWCFGIRGNYEDYTPMSLIRKM